MTTNTNNLAQETPFPTILHPGEVISLQELKSETNSTDKPDQLASGFLAHSQQPVINDDAWLLEEELPDSQNMMDSDLPMPTVNDSHPDANFAPPESDAERLKSIARGAREILISVQTVLPPMVHPSSLTVDRQKLTMVHRTFWGSTDTVSVQMDDINNVEAFIGPFFGEIRIYSKYFINNVQKLAGLYRQDAIAVRRLIQGYMIAHNKGIDCSQIEKKELLSLLEELGRGSR